MKRGFALLAVLTLGVAAVSAGAITLSAAPLADQADQYDETGNVTASYDRVQLAVTVAEDSSDAGLDGFRYTDLDNTYVRIDYDEGIKRTLRIPIPSDYFRPRPKDDLEAVNADATATLRRTADANQTIMEVVVDGPTDATFQISKEAGIVFSVRDGVRSRWSNATGIDIPSIQSRGSWTVIEDPLQPRSTYVINHSETPGDVAVQYDVLRDNGTRWNPAAPCDTEDTAICVLERASNETMTTILVDTDDPPPVRYKANPGIVDQVQGAINNAVQAVATIEDTIQNALDSVPFL